MPPTFGAFARRTYANDNPLIGYPLAYQYMTTMRADALAGERRRAAREAQPRLAACAIPSASRRSTAACRSSARSGGTPACRSTPRPRRHRQRDRRGDRRHRLESAVRRRQRRPPDRRARRAAAGRAAWSSARRWRAVRSSPTTPATRGAASNPDDGASRRRRGAATSSTRAITTCSASKRSSAAGGCHGVGTAAAAADRSASLSHVGRRTLQAAAGTLRRRAMRLPRIQRSRRHAGNRCRGTRR